MILPGAQRSQFQTTDFTDFTDGRTGRRANPWKSVKSVVPNRGACGALSRL
jgi:hypothetical protein